MKCTWIQDGYINLCRYSYFKCCAGIGYRHKRVLCFSFYYYTLWNVWKSSNTVSEAVAHLFIHFSLFFLLPLGLTVTRWVVLKNINAHRKTNKWLFCDFFSGRALSRRVTTENAKPKAETEIWVDYYLFQDANAHTHTHSFAQRDENNTNLLRFASTRSHTICCRACSRQRNMIFFFSKFF